MLYFEDLKIGYRYGLDAPAAPPYGPHQVTREQIIEFGEQWDPRPQHVDEAAARETTFGGLIASGAHAFALWTRFALETANKTERIAIIAGLGSDFRIAAPIRPDDVLSLQVEIVAKRESQSRPDSGIVTAEHALSNQSGVVVLTNRAVTLVSKRPA
ncbi:MAG: MaoC/PaaZ C-terminal domain-containing protein [Myxococcota bacterium]